MKNVHRAIMLASALALLAGGAAAQRSGARDAGAPDAAHDAGHADAGRGAATTNAEDTSGDWQELGSRTVNGARDRDTIRVARRHNPLTHVLVRVQQSDIEIYDMVITFSDGSTFAPELRVTFNEGSRSRRIDLPGTARVIRKVEFRYGNLAGGGNARVELLGQS